MSNRTEPDDRRFGWKGIGYIAIFLLVVVGVSGLLSDRTLAGFLGNAITALVLSILGILSARYKLVEVALEKFFSASLRFFVWTFITLLPIVLFNWLSSILLTRLSLIFQIAVFVGWGLVLAYAIQAIATPTRRDRLFGTKSEPNAQSGKNAVSGLIGNPTPAVYALDLLLIATIFFSTLTFVLVERGVVTLSEPVERVDDILAFYLWHFFEAIPLLKVNETLQWKQPLTYQAGLLGVIVLLFKLTVILPVIAAFSWYWKEITAPEEEKQESESRPRSYRPRRSSMSPHVLSSSRNRSDRLTRITE